MVTRQHAKQGTPPRRWRFLLDEGQSGVRNMAVDHALATQLVQDTGVLRLYTWARPTLSFGRNEPTRGLYDAAIAVERGVDIVRRPTGGRAVLHHNELTYAVVVGVGALGGLKETYGRINEALVQAMRMMGAPATLAQATGPALPPDAGPCFDVPAEGEVIAAGRKLVGSAQVRIGRAVLQHGSIILGGDQRIIADLGGPAPAQPATLASLIGEAPTRSALDDTLLAAFSDRMGGEWQRSDLTRAEAGAADDLVARYGDPEWTWRR